MRSIGKAIGALLMLTIVIGLTVLFHDLFTTTPAEQAANLAEHEALPVVDVTPHELIDAYYGNAAAADLEYGGPGFAEKSEQRFRIQGTVHSIAADGTVALTSRGAGAGAYYVGVILSPEAAAELQRWSAVTAECNGFTYLETMGLIVGTGGVAFENDCRLVSTPARRLGRSTIPVTSGRQSGREAGTLGRGLSCDQLLRQTLQTNPVSLANSDNVHLVIKEIQAREECPKSAWNPQVGGTVPSQEAVHGVALPGNLCESNDCYGNTWKANPVRDSRGNIAIAWHPANDDITTTQDRAEFWLYTASSGSWWSE